MVDNIVQHVFLESEGAFRNAHALESGAHHVHYETVVASGSVVLEAAQFDF
jgi:hypothetical protein